ncbi:hypothetical protein [Sulfurimonas sp.]|uniref:hypothetical protein n=1 Tax=Sulfurimonas sp. TaxID=2022749 RepID=UPI003562B391
MKYFLLLILIVGFLNADEIKRIESIVEDITKLRVKYQECQDTNLETDSKLVKLEKQLDKYKKLLKAKENELFIYKSQKNKDKVVEKVKISVCKDIDTDKPNKFPKLVLKDKFNAHKIINTNPSTYRLKNNAKIYDSINGKVIEEWENKTSFTSNKKSDGWVKITGFFINKVWVRSESQMWIKLKDVQKR